MLTRYTDGPDVGPQDRNSDQQQVEVKTTTVESWLQTYTFLRDPYYLRVLLLLIPATQNNAATLHFHDDRNTTFIVIKKRDIKKYAYH